MEFMMASQNRSISDNLTEKHIDKILELNGKQIEYEHESEKQGRKLLFSIYIITAIYF